MVVKWDYKGNLDDNIVVFKRFVLSFEPFIKGHSSIFMLRIYMDDIMEYY